MLTLAEALAAATQYPHGALFFLLKRTSNALMVRTDGIKREKGSTWEQMHEKQKGKNVRTPHVFPLPAPSSQGPRLLSVGRSKDQHIRIEHSSVSLEHGFLVLHPDGRVALIDQGSTNGTLVKGKQLSVGSPEFLVSKSPIAIGDIQGWYVAASDVQSFIDTTFAE